MAMKKVLYLLLVSVIVASCGGGSGTTAEYRKAKGGVYYGGVFRMNEVRFP